MGRRKMIQDERQKKQEIIKSSKCRKYAGKSKQTLTVYNAIL